MTAGDNGGFVGTIKIGCVPLVSGGGEGAPAVACDCVTPAVAGTVSGNPERALKDMAIIQFEGTRSHSETSKPRANSILLICH